MRKKVELPHTRYDHRGLTNPNSRLTQQQLEWILDRRDSSYKWGVKSRLYKAFCDLFGVKYSWQAFHATLMGSRNAKVVLELIVALAVGTAVTFMALYAGTALIWEK